MLDLQIADLTSIVRRMHAVEPGLVRRAMPEVTDLPGYGCLSDCEHLPPHKRRRVSPHALTVLLTVAILATTVLVSS